MSDDLKVWAGSNMNPLVVLGYNTSGMDAGELDFSLACARVAELDAKDRQHLIQLLKRVETACYNTWGIS